MEVGFHESLTSAFLGCLMLNNVVLLQDHLGSPIRHLTAFWLLLIGCLSFPILCDIAE